MMSSAKSCNHEIDDISVETIKSILKRGGDVEIRKRGDGYVVLEVKKKIKYCT